jgi:hypothetical protein
VPEHRTTINSFMSLSIIPAGPDSVSFLRSFTSFAISNGNDPSPRAVPRLWPSRRPVPTKKSETRALSVLCRTIGELCPRSVFDPRSGVTAGKRSAEGRLVVACRPRIMSGTEVDVKSCNQSASQPVWISEGQHTLRIVLMSISSNS